MYSVYTLSCPITNVVKYVGITQQILSKRLMCHCSDIKGNNKKQAWIKELRLLKLKPSIELIETFDKYGDYDPEMYWIHQFNSWGFELLNTRRLR